MCHGEMCGIKEGNNQALVDRKHESIKGEMSEYEMKGRQVSEIIQVY